MFRQAPSFPYHDLGIVEDGNTASRAISKDAYVIWKGESYFASTDILQGATLEEDVNLTAIPDGVINGVVEAAKNNLLSHKYSYSASYTGNVYETSTKVKIVGEGLAFMQVYTVSPSGDYGTVCSAIRDSNNSTLQSSQWRTPSATGYSDFASCCIFVPVNDGDVFNLASTCTRTGSKTAKFDVVTVGCEAILPYTA